MNYHKKQFRQISSSDNGEVDDNTVFTYYQHNTLLVGEYSGGVIKHGHIVGTVHDDGSLTFHYNHINSDGNLRTGICKSTPETMDNGKIRLYEKWEWVLGDSGTGESVLEEI